MCETCQDKQYGYSSTRGSYFCVCVCVEVNKLPRGRKLHLINTLISAFLPHSLLLFSFPASLEQLLGFLSPLLDSYTERSKVIKTSIVYVSQWDESSGTGLTLSLSFHCPHYQEISIRMVALF